MLRKAITLLVLVATLAPFAVEAGYVQGYGAPGTILGVAGAPGLVQNVPYPNVYQPQPLDAGWGWPVAQNTSFAWVIGGTFLAILIIALILGCLAFLWWNSWGSCSNGGNGNGNGRSRRVQVESSSDSESSAREYRRHSKHSKHSKHSSHSSHATKKHRKH